MANCYEIMLGDFCDKSNAVVFWCQRSYFVYLTSGSYNKHKVIRGGNQQINLSIRVIGILTLSPKCFIYLCTQV